MARMNQKGRTAYERYVKLPHRILNSEAWRNLSLVARNVWLLLAQRFNGYNNGNISLSCREVAQDLNISKDTASRAFDDLQEKGFIVLTQESQFNMKGAKARQWALTHYSVNDARPTDEWRDWKKQKSVRPEGHYGPISGTS